MKCSSELDNFIKENKDIFEGIGTFPDVMKIKLTKGVIPIVNPPRRVPLTIKKRLGETLKLLTDKEITQPVNEPLEWVNNIVIIEKPNKTLKICIDPNELNKHIVQEIYPVPTLEEITPKLNNKNIFCVFDIKDAFYHIKLDEKSSNYCTFSSPYGCFKFLRAPFGLASIPEIFQKLVNKYFGDIKNVIVYFDDILCATNTKKEMDETVKEVTNRAKQFNIKFNPDKIQYYENEVKYLGLLFSKNGMRPDNDRITAIKELAIPNNKKQLQSILGIINYVRQFIPNLAELSSPLRELLKNKTLWQWTNRNTEIFNKIKTLISEL